MTDENGIGVYSIFIKVVDINTTKEYIINRFKKHGWIAFRVEFADPTSSNITEEQYKRVTRNGPMKAAYVYFSKIETSSFIYKDLTESSKKKCRYYLDASRTKHWLLLKNLNPKTKEEVRAMELARASELISNNLLD